MKLSNKYWLTLFSTGLLCSSILVGKPLDISDQEKDMRIMRGILESSLDSSREDFPGKPNIKSTYLAEQGFLFTIRLNGLGGFGIPGVAAWDSGRLELDIPEIIEEAFSAIEYSEVLAPEVIADIEDVLPAQSAGERYNTEQSEKSREYQDKLRVLREQQRDLRRDIYDLSRDVRRSKEDSDRAKLKSKLDKARSDLELKKESYNDMLGSYKTERLSKQVARSDKAIDAILQTLCDYGQTMRTLKKGEKVNLLVQGGVTENGERASQMFIFDQKDIKGCKSLKSLREDVIYYTL